MFNWLRKRLRTWLADAEPSAAKAPRSATLTDYMGGTGGAGRSPKWDDQDTRRHHVEWVYSAVRAISHRIAGQSIKVGRRASTAAPPRGAKAASGSPTAGGRVKELPAHPLLEMLAHPNPYTVPFSLVALTVASLEVAGTAFWWIDRESDDATRVWYLPSGWMRDDPEAPLPLTRWFCRPEASGEEFRLDHTEVIRFALPDPANPLQPLSPLKALIRSAVADREIQASQLAAFRNDGRPGLVVRVGRNSEGSPIGATDDAPVLTRQQRKQLAELIKQSTSGAINAGEPLILDGFIKEVDRVTNLPSEMAFQESALLTRDRILAGFGVPKVCIGMTDDANRASAVVSDETFCFATCGPLCRLIGDHLTGWFRRFFEDESLVVWVDPPRPRDPDGRRADLQQLVGAGSITVDELRAEHGLDPLPGGAGTALVKAPAPATPAPAAPALPAPAGA